MKRAGHQEIHGETIAQFEFSQAGWNPFRHYRDEDQVDLLLRRRREPLDRPEYREIQVKWCRTWGSDELSAWKRPFFTHESWRNFPADEFLTHRPELFVAIVLPQPGGTYTGDFFLFTSEEFHALIQCAPLHKQGESTRCFTLACTHDQRWFLLRQRNKFENVCGTSAREVTHARRNFAALDLS
ncbi:MAG: hypothetical protein H0X66_22300 [Verrucomicrobia bacterium]|nr:hypothetical protein [Verrucomicrobiota bacterium]